MERWWERAACRGLPTRLFYPDVESASAEGTAVCTGCVVRQECFHYAITTYQKEGTWGGLSQWERQRVYRRMLRARAQERKIQETAGIAG